MSRFAERVKEQRLQIGLQQAQLAERVGVTGQTVSLWERGLRYPAPVEWDGREKVVSALNSEDIKRHVRVVSVKVTV